jgi:hypothetical protein
MRNNYADNDAEASFKVITTGASDDIIEASQEDQFWVVDWVTVSAGGNGAKTVSIKFGSDTEWTAIVHTNTCEHFTFNPPLYANGRTKNEALIVSGTSGATVSIRYR